MSLSISLSIGNQNYVGTVVPGPTAAPALSSRAFHFMADAITPQADNTGLGTWTDSVAGISMTQATGANQPLYRTSRMGGKPALQFDGSRCMTLGRPTQLTSAMANYNTSTGVTMFFIMGNLSAADDGFNTFWAPSNVNDGGRAWEISNGRCGPRGDPRLFTSLGTGIQIIVVRSDSDITNSPSGGAFFYHNMNAYTGVDLSDPGSGNYVVGSADTSLNWSLKGDMMELGCYNRSLTNAEIAQLTKYACDKYGQAYPWAGASRFVVYDGDSITHGQGCSGTTGRNPEQNGWTQLLMDAKSQPFGAWSNMAVSSRTSAQMTASVTKNYAGLAAQLGMKVVLIGNEYHNQADANASGMKAYTAAVKAADANIITLIWDSIDAYDITPSNRTSFNTAIAADTNTNVKCPMSTETHVGVAGAAGGTSSASTYFADGIHPNNLGNTFMQSFIGSYYDTAVAL